ncbi:MAG: hypothetical protein ABII06_14900, partial [Pseudomonadota bacterium]
ETIQSWIGTDEEIEKMLFWDKGGKYDDPEWRRLRPVDEAAKVLHEKAGAHLKQLRVEAVESQRRSDLTLFSQFNNGLLFTGLAGAVRCDDKGSPDEAGSRFKGLEWRCVGSVEENIHSITIFPIDADTFEVHLGPRKKGEAEGVWIYTGDSHSLLQLAQVSEKILPKHGFKTAVRNRGGEGLHLDAREIRKSAMGEGEKVGFGKELNLFASVRVKGMDQAVAAADNLWARIYERFGLEMEAHNIGKKYNNFFIMREENFDRFLPAAPVDHKGLVLLTATLVCRRCRREMDEFRDLAKNYPHLTAVLVNLSSPQFKFYERVFGDMGGGDADEFRKNAAGVTPFIIIYTADEKGILKYREYVSTGKAENTVSIRASMPRLDQHFNFRLSKGKPSHNLRGKIHE